MKGREREKGVSEEEKQTIKGMRNQAWKREMGWHKSDSQIFNQITLHSLCDS